MMMCKYLNPHCRNMLQCSDEGLGERPNPELTLVSPGGQHRVAAVAGNAPLYSGTPHPSTWAQSVRKKMTARMRKYSFKAVQIKHLTDFKISIPTDLNQMLLSHCGKTKQKQRPG